MRKLFTICIALLLILCMISCAKPESDVPETESVIQVETTTPQTECPVTSNPESTETQAPTEDPSIGIDAGSYLMTYQDEDLGDYLDYYLFIPDNAKKHMPLVIFLHGDGEVGKPEKLENYGLIKCAKDLYGNDYPFLAISPSTRIKSWTNDPIPELLKSLIDDLSNKYQINTNKIIITGHSRGSAGVWHMISKYGCFFSAAVPISSPPQTARNRNNSVLVPIRAFAGNIGEFEIWSLNEMQKEIAVLTDLGGNCEFIPLISCDHSETIDAAFTQETFDWMLAQERNESNNETIQ